MKKIIKLSLVCAVLFSGMSTYAIDGNEEFNLHVLKNGKVITFGLNQVQKANLAIYDQDGTLFYSESASGKDGILRTFSLQDFPDGTYFLEVEDNAKKVRYQINVDNDVTTLSPKAISSVYKVADKNTSVAVR
ncbi:putative secreted protein (Por secretion system target) [Flavobacterium chryseum]|uniref:T9SS type A sorting domain-containing protein n=1 Tax=Flavobacterium sp. P3160 TaxID=2512113 RepID=UPI00105B811F|nr:T9SS type A sorting domain-containing protein [Flavobacterium sp. P3160]TDO72960.1 putative secreted protein (Por secretion system target) [Flavobacterium sp. P3160]